MIATQVADEQRADPVDDQAQRSLVGLPSAAVDATCRDARRHYIVSAMIALQVCRRFSAS